MESIEIDGSALLSLLVNLKSCPTGLLLGFERIISHTIPLAHENLNKQAFQVDYLRSLKTNNYDTNVIGWFISLPISDIWTVSFLDSQVNHQMNIPEAFVLIHDPSMSQSLPFIALRFKKVFIDFYQTRNYELLKQIGPKDMYETMKITVTKSHLLEAYIKNLNFNQENESDVYNIHPTIPESVQQRFYSDFSSLSYPTNFKSLEKNLEYLSETVDDLCQEQWKWINWHRSLQKEKAKLSVIQSKKAESDFGSLTIIDEELLNVNNSIKKLCANEPHRLESFNLINQVDFLGDEIICYSDGAVNNIKLMKLVNGLL